MLRLTSVATLGFILLISTITYAGDELSPVDKNLIFKPTNAVVPSRPMIHSEMTTTKGTLLPRNIPVGTPIALIFIASALIFLPSGTIPSFPIIRAVF